MNKRLAREQLESIRYIDDKSFDSEGSLKKDDLKKIKNRFLLNHFPVSRKLLPEIYKQVETCLEILELNTPEHNAFIFAYASSEINAQCLVGFEGDIVILLSSESIKTLKKDELKFLVGHELGHYIFHQNSLKDFGQKNLEYLILSRAREISADRVGLLCSQSLDTSVRAISKTLSGLDETHLSFNAQALLEEFKKVDPLHIPYEEIYSTHPPLPIRLRALLWFSLSKIFLRLTGQDPSGGLENSYVDLKVQNDMKKYLNSNLDKSIEQRKKEFYFWSLVFIFLKNGTLEKSEQKVISDIFSPEKLKSLINLLNTSSKKNILNHISNNCLEAFYSYFDIAPKSAVSFLSSFNKEVEPYIENENGLSYLLNGFPKLRDYLKAS